MLVARLTSDPVEMRNETEKLSLSLSCSESSLSGLLCHRPVDLVSLPKVS